MGSAIIYLFVSNPSPHWGCQSVNAGPNKKYNTADDGRQAVLKHRHSTKDAYIYTERSN